MVKRALACLLLFCAVESRAQFDLSIGDVAQSFGIDLGQFDVAGFWSTAEKALHAESVDDLVALMPEARRALNALDQIPSARPYADWLRQRMDFFEVASESQDEVVPPRPTGTRPPPTPQERQRISQTARRQKKWEQKIGSRAAPGNAANLVPRLKGIFKSQGLPPQLIWLAEVESTMNPGARSPVGAAGLFQMMPATAQRFGLKLSPEDERLIADKNAAAAAQYLKILHRRFGNWSLALAAYNAGEGRVSAVMKQTGGKTFDGIADRLPVETQMYVPKMRALLKLREAAELDALPAPRA